VAQALSQAIVTSRRGPSLPATQQRGGRLDRRLLARTAVSDGRVFVRNAEPGPDRIRVSILLDASASMDGWDWSGTTRMPLADIACQTGRDLAMAMERLPWVHADIWAFTTGYGSGHQGTVMHHVWESGEPTSNVDSYSNIHKSGTEEGYAIAFALDEMMERITDREQGLIIIVSDGQPSEPKHVAACVAMAAEKHVPVVSVALNDSAAQPLMYGKENVVRYHDNPRTLARDMAKVIGRVL
jgi:nitric oxide reductase activation protein